MRKVKKFTVLLVVVFMFVSVFSACGTKSQPSNESASSKSAPATTVQPAEATQSAPELTGLAATWPEFAKHHEVQVLCVEQGWTGPVKDKDFVTPEIANRTNMLIKYEPLTCANTDANHQKVNLMAASGEVPEVFMGAPDAFSQNIYKILGKNGLIWDIGPLMKDYKNLSNLLAPELIMYRDTETEANYTLPAQTGKGGGDSSGGVPNGIYIRQDWLNKLGLSYPTTPDELYTYLKRCKDEIKTVNGKNVIPLTFDENLDHMDSRFLSSIFCPLNYYSDQDPVNYTGFTLAVDPKENKVVNYGYTDSPELMAGAKFLNKLYKDGLLDKEVLTQKRTQFEEKISSGRVAMHIAPVWDIKSFTDNAKTVVPGLMYVVTPAFKTPGVPKYTDTKYTNYVGASDLLFFSKKLDEETVRHFLAMLDYLATKDGQLLVQYGIEGKSYKIGSDGKLVMTEQFKTDTGDLDWNKQSAYGVQYW